MYHHIEGELALLGSTRAVVDAGGVGYECRIPLSTFSALKGREHSRVRLFTHLHVLEDDLRLYGFASERERELFRVVTAISGVGPAIALAILASFDPGEFAGAIARSDAKALQRIKGVGTKLSERLVLELKDRVEALAALAGPGQPPTQGRPVEGGVEAQVLADAVAILVELGFSPKEAKTKVDGALGRLLAAAREAPGPTGSKAPAITVETIVQAALRTRS
jgi:Holliday junction DNA helicase RuvA